MRKLGTAVDKLALWMHWLSGAILILMMLTVIVDIVTRTLFGMTAGASGVTVRGAVEIVSYGLLFMILFTLPHSVSRAQVVVDLFTERWSTAVKLRVSALYTLGFGLLGAAMAERFYQSAYRVAASGQTTQDLQVPLWLPYGVASFAAGMLAVRCVVVGLRRFAGRDAEALEQEQSALAKEGRA
jgi:TRAP-type C4-dicarboxylate transport system permease small subunit